MKKDPNFVSSKEIRVKQCDSPYGSYLTCISMLLDFLCTWAVYTKGYSAIFTSNKFVSIMKNDSISPIKILLRLNDFHKSKEFHERFCFHNSKNVKRHFYCWHVEQKLHPSEIFS